MASSRAGRALGQAGGGQLIFMLGAAGQKPGVVLEGILTIT